MKGIKFGTVKIVPAKGVTGLPKQGSLVVEDEMGIIIKAEVKGTKKNPGGEALVRIPSTSYRCFMSVPEATEETAPKKRGRKPGKKADAEETTPKKRGRKPGKKAKLVKKVKKAKLVKKVRKDAEEVTPKLKKGKKGKKLRIKKGKKHLKERAKISNLLQGARKL